MRRGDASALNWATGRGTEGVNAALGAWGDALDPSQFMSAEGAYSPLDTYATEVGRVLSEHQLPGIDTAAAGAGLAGGYSSKRNQMEAMARARAAGDIAQFGANLTGQLYGQGINARNAALGYAPMMYDLGLQPGRTLYNVGAGQRAEQYTRQGMNNAETAWEQSEPYQRLSALGGQLAGYAGLGGTSKSEGVTEGTSTSQTRGSLAGTIMGLGSMAAGMFNPMAQMVGAGMSGGGAGPVWNSPMNPWMANSARF